MIIPTITCITKEIFNQEDSSTARKTVPLEINDNDSVALLRMSTGSDAELALRARIVLACAESTLFKLIFSRIRSPFK